MMTPREAFHAAMNHQQPDRVLLDMGKHIGSLHRRAYVKLRDHLGNVPMENENRVLDQMAQTVWPDEALLQRLDVDFRWVVPNWVQLTERSDVEGYIDMWGVPYRALEDWDHCVVDGAPMREATIDQIDDFQWPDAHDPEQFAGLREQAKYYYEETDYVVGADAIKAGMLMNSLQLRGYDQFFMDLVLDVPLAEKLMDKITQTLKDMWTHYMEAVGPYVQVAYVTDDFGTQKSLMLSPPMFRDLIKPRWTELISHIKSLGDVKVMFHSDGAILPLLEDFVDMGVDILNPVQTSVKGIQDTWALKEEFGDRMCFHGAIDVQQMLPNATTSELEAEVAQRIYDLGRNGGYILAPCHNIGHDIPSKNIVTLFETARRLGGDPAALKEFVDENPSYFKLHGVSQ
ncbi:MAG: uroporphyrinogen decarboxylase family protein [Xanthomonadales bacterium]|jgi:uroporphyrinogen decarboxylase|nr:uroporphyrinogen decarboxylase family protein [Xanthomonadales bacterium]